MGQANDITRTAVLVEQLGCMTDEDLQALTKVKATTTKYWRRKGSGPAYVLAGNVILYPRAAVSEWLHARLRAQSQARDERTS